MGLDINSSYIVILDGMLKMVFLEILESAKYAVFALAVT